MREDEQQGCARRQTPELRRHTFRHSKRADEGNLETASTLEPFYDYEE